jgi:WD40 repeat protein
LAATPAFWRWLIYAPGFYILDLSNPSAPARLFRHPRATWACVSLDGRWVASCTHNGDGIKVWDVATGKSVCDLAQDNHAATLSLSPDGKSLVTATSSEFAIWDVGSWTLRRRIPREQSFNTGSAVFSRDGKVLALTLAPSTVDLLDSADGRHLARLQALDTGWLSLIGFTPDGGQLCAYGAWDTCVWDLREIGARLREIGLGWELGPPGPPSPLPPPARVEYVGVEADQSKDGQK